MEDSSPETVSPSDTNIAAPKKRGGANRKERKRTQTMNSAFSELRNRIPNVPPDTKLSKIKTLRLAISYIRYLMDILAEDAHDGKLRSHKDFAIELAEQNDRRDKRKKEISVSGCFSSDLLLVLYSKVFRFALKASMKTAVAALSLSNILLIVHRSGTKKAWTNWMAATRLGFRATSKLKYT